jgi:hemerythrin-like domain-containing protein
MRAIEILTEEHELLRRLLEGLEELVDEATHADRFDAETTAEVLTALARFGDGCHQDKEETCLFRTLLVHECEEVRETVRGLLDVHEDERRLLEELRECFEAAAYGDPWSRDLFVDRCRAYVDLQRRHASAEDEELFPLAEERLDERRDAAIVHGFEVIDRDWTSRPGGDPRRVVREVLERLERAVPAGS